MRTVAVPARMILKIFMVFSRFGAAVTIDLMRGAGASHALVGDLRASDLVAQEEAYLGARTDDISSLHAAWKFRRRTRDHAGTTLFINGNAIDAACISTVLRQLKQRR